MKRAAFFDVDGTLWDYKNFIPESTKRAIGLLKENKVLTFINTGRTKAFLQNEELFSLGFDGIVSGCGTMIELDGERLFHYEMNQEDILRTLSVTRQHGYKDILEGAENLYLDIAEFEGDLYGEKVIHEMGDRLLPIIGNEGHYHISKLSSDTKSTSAEDRNAVIDELSELFHFIIHNEDVVEMVPKGFSKGTGIQKVCQLLDIDIADTYAFGDSVNDLEMLKTAGHAIVMGNGVDEAKAVAEFVTDDLYQDGIFHACQHYQLI